MSENNHHPGHILAEQIVRQDTLDAKAFLMAVIRIILRLACAEIVLAVLVFLTKKTVFNLAFYAYAIILVFQLLYRVIASDRYVLTADKLVLEKRMGETVTKSVTVPMDSLAAIREHFAAERVHISYTHTDVFLRQTVVPFRVRLGQFLAWFSARLARRVAGPAAEKPVGLVIAYYDRDRVKACVFEPDTDMINALAELAGERMGLDDRLGRPYLKTFSARSLARAFPNHYPNVQPLITPEDLAWADERKAEREAKRLQRREEASRQREAAERRREASAQEAARVKEKKAKRAHKKKARKYRDEDIFPDEAELTPEEPRFMDIPEHPEVVSVEYNPAAATGRRRRGSRRDGEDDAGKDSIL